MTPTLGRRRVAALLLALAGAPAFGMAVKGEPSPSPTDAPAPRRPVPATLDLVEGRVTAVDLRKGTLVVNGQALAIDTRRVPVFVGGHRAGADVLAPGMQVRFALAPDAGAPRRVVAVYVERR